MRRVYIFSGVNGNQVIEFRNKHGQIVLKKVQSTSRQSAGYGGWICTYSVFDDFGLPRFQIQPMGVQFLDANQWNFAVTNGPTVPAEQVFQYNYDYKGRFIWKKASGVPGLNLIYDIRDRVVFMQDGNQAAFSTPQWTVNLYDPLDRPVATTLFNTTETIASLQSDLTSAAATSSVSVTTAANTGGVTVPLALSICPVSINCTSLNSSTTTQVVKYLFYDNYSFPVVTAFNTSYTNLTAYSTSDPNVIPIAPSLRTWNLPTGNMLRVLGSTSMFLPTTDYYDEKGRHIQASESNIRNGTDVTTIQYRRDGRMLSTCNSHTNSVGGYSAYITLTKYIFDNIGQVDSLQKTYGSNAVKTVATYQYDDQGRMATKNLDPAYANVNSGSSGLESLNYSYNIHNQITGINKDYANKNPAHYNKWSHFFGEYLGYDNSDGLLANTQLDGQVTGKIWNTQGDDNQRRYDYTYDNANRLIKAIYQEAPTPGTWSENIMNFRMTGHNGQDNKIPIHQLVSERIGEISEGVVFDYSSFGVPPAGELSLAKALSRLSQQEVIVRLSKGKYNVLIIGTGTVLPPKRVGQYRVKYSKRTAPLTPDSIPLLQLLDALKDIKKIGDADVNESLVRLIEVLKKLSSTQLEQLVVLAGSYNAATRALLGAVFEAYLPEVDTNSLKKSINVFTRYEIGVSKDILPNPSNWYIL